MRAATAASWIIASTLQPLCLAIMLALIGFGPHCDVSPAKHILAKAQINAYMKALENYQSDVGGYPTMSQGLDALRMNAGVRGWNGPYVQQDISPDPWGGNYAYRYCLGGAPKIVSFVAADYRARLLARTVVLVSRTPPFLAAAVGFFGYPFLPAILRRVNRRPCEPH